MNLRGGCLCLEGLEVARQLESDETDGLITVGKTHWSSNETVNGSEEKQESEQ